MFILVLTTTAYAPLELLQGWLAEIARINPLTQVVDAARQGFIGDPVSWAGTWPGLVALAVDCPSVTAACAGGIFDTSGAPAGVRGWAAFGAKKNIPSHISPAPTRKAASAYTA